MFSDSLVPLLEFYTEEIITKSEKYTKMFAVELCRVLRSQKLPKHPVIRKWVQLIRR